MLLVDEIDRADDEFEAFLLEVLSTYQVTIPELGTVVAADPAGRGAHLQPHPRGARRPEAALPLPLDRAPRPRARGRDRPLAGLPEVSEALAGQVVALVQRLRDRDDLLKPPGVAETLDWARALDRLGARELDVEPRGPRPSAPCVKYREDAERVRAALDRMLARMSSVTADVAPLGTSPTSCCSASPGRCGRPGVPVTPDRAQTFLHAVAHGRRRRPAGDLLGRPRDAVRRPRATCDRYDQVFTGLVPRRAAERGGGRAAAEQPPPVAGAARRDERAGERRRRTTTRLLRATASDAEVLRHRDIATLDAARAGPAGRAVRRAAPRSPPRRVAYRRTAVAPRRGRHPTDAARDARAGWASRSRSPGAAGRSRPRRLVLLVDVSAR